MPGEIKQKILDLVGQEPTNLDQLAQCVIRVIDNCLANSRVLGFSWEIRYFDKVSCAHSAPEGRQINWQCSLDRPSFFPGFRGRVWIRYAHTTGFKKFLDHPFNRTLTHIGSMERFADYSGPWSNCYHAWRQCHKIFHHQNLVYPEPLIFTWDYRFYLEDWPGIANWVEQQAVIAGLHGQPRPEIIHRFVWEDPATVEEDRRFIQQVEEANLLTFSR